ncbi:hypothetical protein [Leeuwenhoekiella marinoflava]|uniref:Uncharacterized protein n=2 Tax=Leeuwenhoekiella marinoflava TaxID=988 RepID=A0A4Q0PKJ8_9FLAO|nr:hypothetical protein [Leeuwenhoekiella marinoflava]RXG28451.1 hypothetical protein DSL99_2452 [Leeuwenhoekiella marinoflava]SHF52155.1 hypothetical protein SAMN02745246_02742 [Leeuwenhoekiella marinoflava DSM 3653]
MNTEKLKLDTTITAVKDSLKQGIFKWKDTGKNISYYELLNIFEMNEPLTNEQAHKLYSSLSNDSRIVNSLHLKKSGNNNFIK